MTCKHIPQLDRKRCNTQQANLQRVSDNIAHEVLWFCRNRFHAGLEFHMHELTTHIYINTSKTTAPDSPSRILRDLRRRGLVDYVVVSRAQSLYRVTGVRG